MHTGGSSDIDLETSSSDLRRSYSPIYDLKCGMTPPLSFHCGYTTHTLPAPPQPTLTETGNLRLVGLTVTNEPIADVSCVVGNELRVKNVPSLLPTILSSTGDIYNISFTSPPTSAEL